MYNEIIFTDEKPPAKCPYVGGGAFMPQNIDWPCDETGLPLMHLMAIPYKLINDLSPSEIWISIFIPFTPDEVKHFRLLRLKDASSSAKVISYEAASESRNDYKLRNFEAKMIKIIQNDEPDDEENLASKVLGIPAFLQDPVHIEEYEYALEIYGGDLDTAFPSAKGILSDGMGYLFVSNKLLSGNAEQEAGKFFLQLG